MHQTEESKSRTIKRVKHEGKGPKLEIVRKKEKKKNLAERETDLCDLFQILALVRWMLPCID